jgi:peptidylprolyl isomerase
MLFSIGLIGLALVACGQGNPGNSTRPSTTRQTAAATPSTDENVAPSLAKTASSSRRGRLAMTKAEIARLPQYRIGPPHGPPAKRLVIRDLRKGFGAKMKVGDTILVDFGAAEYGFTDKTTPATRNPPEKRAFKELMKGWQLGLPGMRVGGRRKLIVPKTMGPAGSSATYVVDLLAIYPKPTK